MTTLPTTIALALSTVALAAATASTADAKPHRTKRVPAARPLVRATPVATVAPVVPLVAASERPVCGNIASKGPSRRECTDALGTSYYRENNFSEKSFSDPSSGWTFNGRRCVTPKVEVILEVSGRATVITNDNTRLAERVIVEPGAASTEPLVTTCRRGLP